VAGKRVGLLGEGAHGADDGLQPPVADVRGERGEVACLDGGVRVGQVGQGEPTDTGVTVSYGDGLHIGSFHAASRTLSGALVDVRIARSSWRSAASPADCKRGRDRSGREARYRPAWSMAVKDSAPTNEMYR
jgi:hypothetical protein